MRKMHILLLCAVLCVMLCSCGKSRAEGETQVSPVYVHKTEPTEAPAAATEPAAEEQTEAAPAEPVEVDNIAAFDEPVEGTTASVSGGSAPVSKQTAPPSAPATAAPAEPESETAAPALVQPETQTESEDVRGAGDNEAEWSPMV